MGPCACQFYKNCQSSIIAFGDILYVISNIILKISLRYYKCHKLLLSKGKWISSEQRVESWKFHFQNSHTVHLFQYLPGEVLGFGRWLFYFYFCILSLSRAELLCMLTASSKKSHYIEQSDGNVWEEKWMAGGGPSQIFQFICPDIQWVLGHGPS